MIFRGIFAFYPQKCSVYAGLRVLHTSLTGIKSPIAYLRI